MEHENLKKHMGSHWMVDRDVACSSVAVKCIVAFRSQFHIYPDRMDDIARFHSGYVESMICWRSGGGANPSSIPPHLAGRGFIGCGIARQGGWMNFGVLLINDGITESHYPLATDPSPVTLNPKRVRRWYGGVYANSQNRGSTWYGAHGVMTIAIFIEVLDALEPNAFLTSHYHCPAYGPGGGDVAQLCVGKPGIPSYAARQNGSTYGQHIIGYNIRETLNGISMDGVNDSRVAHNGYSDRYGKVVNGCTAVALDCVPFVIEGGVPIGDVQFNLNDAAGRFEMDTPAISVGQYWIRYRMGQ